MSNEVMTNVWENPCQSHVQQLVLVALADHADEEGGECWPGFGRLAKRCALDRSAVIRAIAALEEGGRISVTRNNGSPGPHEKRSNLYKVHMVNGSLPTTSSSKPLVDASHQSLAATRRSRPPTSGSRPPMVVAPSHPGGSLPATRTIIEPSLEPSLEPKASFSEKPKYKTNNLSELPKEATEFTDERRYLFVNSGDMLESVRMVEKRKQVYKSALDRLQAKNSPVLLPQDRVAVEVKSTHVKEKETA